MIEYTLANGGGTFDLSGEPVEFASGYMVGTIRIGKTSLDGLADMLASGQRKLQVLNESHYLGTWIDEFGVIHVDISQRETDLETALKLARDRKEIAIWDCANSSEIIV